MQSCVVCGKQLQDADTFCPVCGHQVAPAPQPAAVPDYQEQPVVSFLRDPQPPPAPQPEHQALQYEEVPASPAQPPEQPPVQPVSADEPPSQSAAFTPAPQPHSPAPAPVRPQQPAARSPKPKVNGFTFFLQNIPGPVLLLLLVPVLLVGSMLEGRFFMPQNLSNILRMFFIYLPLVMGAVLTTRAGGLDISLAGSVTMGGLVYSYSHSILLSALVACLCGFASGVLVALLRLPSITATLCLTPMYVGIAFLFTDGQPVVLDSMEMLSETVVAPVLGCLTLVLSFVYICFTCLGKPLGTRPYRGLNLLFLFAAYPISALFAGMTGALLTDRIRAFSTNLAGANLYSLLIMIWAGIQCSKLFDNRFAPVLCGAFVLLLNRWMGTVFSFMGIAASFQSIMDALIIGSLLLAVGLAQWPYGKKDITI